MTPLRLAGRLVCLISLAMFVALGLAVYATGVLPGDMLLRELVVNHTGIASELTRWVG